MKMLPWQWQIRSNSVKGFREMLNLDIGQWSVRKLGSGFESAIVFSRITLRNFCELKLSLCQKFCLQGSHKVSVYTLSSIIHLILLQKVLICALSCYIWITFWPQTSMGELTALPHSLQLLELLTKFSRIISEQKSRNLGFWKTFEQFEQLRAYKKPL